MENGISTSTLFEKFLSWSRTHRSPRTVEWYANYLNKFCGFNGAASIPAYQLKPYFVQEWIDSHDEEWGNTYKGGAIIAIKRVFNWAEELGYGEGNPIKKLKKPPAERRKSYAKPEGVDLFLRHIQSDDPFRELLIFCWACGCRPQEARHIELRHVDLMGMRIIFPAKESKGKRYERKILINKTTLPIIERLISLYPTGKIFRNTRGDAWTKFALCNRMYRLSKITGEKITAYDLRHGYITRKIKEGVNHMVIAPAVGHTDGSMIGKVYSHVSDDENHMREVLGD